MIRRFLLVILLPFLQPAAGEGGPSKRSSSRKGESTALAPAQLANNSTRVVVGPGDSISIQEFVIAGSESKKVLFRGLGASLGNFGISDFFGGSYSITWR
ncbi:hypothetical protein BH20VER3_BH20VER3_20470 [soil metagenome]